MNRRIKKEKKTFKISKIFFFFIFYLILIESNIYIKRNINNIQPKISIFLPIYNKAKFLNKSIGSLQKQTLRNIEIIPVNDCSEDNSLEILKKMAKRDSRIKIINNDRNRGLLYSRAMGILNSKGEYLLNLDPDDELSGRDNLKYLYTKINKLKIDYITFGHIINWHDSNPSKVCLCSNFSKIQYQPKILNSNIELLDYLIWNKLVKNQLYKKALMLIKEQIYGQKWNYGEDEIWSILINKYANSKLCIKKSIYIYNINKYSLMKNRYSIIYVTNIINWIIILKKILLKNTNIYLNRFYGFIDIINGNPQFLDIVKKNREIKHKFCKVFRNISFQSNNNNSS